jgi:hypothetical protein
LLPPLEIPNLGLVRERGVKVLASSVASRRVEVLGIAIGGRRPAVDGIALMALRLDKKGQSNARTTWAAGPSAACGTMTGGE